MTTRLLSCAVNLPEQIANTLQSFDTRDLSRFAVLLPTQRLQNYLRFYLARHLTACIPPQLYSLSEFVARLPYAGRRRKITAEEQRLLLNALLLERQYRFLSPGMESEMARFFREIVEADLREETFPRLQELLQQDAYRSDEHLQQLQQHVEEWADLYDNYVEFLDKFQLTDEAFDFADRVRALDQADATSRFGFFERLIVAGFSDANPVQQRLFQKLATLPDCEFWFHADPAGVDSLNPQPSQSHPYAVLHRFLNRLGITSFDERVDAPLAAHVSPLRSAFQIAGEADATNDGTTRLTAHRALTLIDEVKGAAALVRDLILKEGLAPEKILVAIPDEAQYARLVWTVFETADIPINFAIGIPFDETQVGQWIRLFFELARHDFRNQDMLGLFSIPISRYWLKAVGVTVEPAVLQNQLQRLIADFDLANHLDAYLDAARSASQQEDTQDLSTFLEALQTTLAPLLQAEALSYREWGEALWQFSEALRLLEIFAWNREDPYNLNMRALRHWYAFLKSLIRAGEVLQENLPLHELYSVLVQNLFRKKVRPAGEPFVGVQIVGLLETRGIPADAVLILGNVEGSFPKLSERELFISESYRRKLGLPTLHHHEQLQDLWFYQLVASVPRVHLFWHEFVDESPQVKSRYLQRLELGFQRHGQFLIEHAISGRALPGDFLLQDWINELPPSLQQEFETLSAHIPARRDERGQFAGDRQALLSRLSAGGLKDLLHCPYRFLLSKLRVEHEKLPEEDADSRQFGQWLHRVLFCFFRGLDDPSLPGAESDLYNPWMEPIHAGNREQALDRLRRLSEVLRAELRGRQESYFQVMYAVWPWLIEEEMKREPWDFDPEDFERKVEATWQDGDSGNLPPVRFSMRIDRLVRSGARIAILDYKTRVPGTSKIAFLDGIDPQLPLYYWGLTQSGLHGEFTGEYVGLLDQKRAVYGESARRGSAARLDEAWSRVQQRLAQRLDMLIGQNQPFEPLDGMLCKYCDYKDICRRDEVRYDVRKFEEADSNSQ